jgi:hypothetical protein
MKTTNWKRSLARWGTLAAALLAPHTTWAHCDSLDGPVVMAARRALAESDVNHVLVWVQKNDEAEIKHAFEKTLAVRKLSAEAKDLADMYFFETLVRIHRAGEGAPFTGLKPAGRDLGLAIPAGDRALQTGNVEPVARLLSEKMNHRLHEQFKAALKRKTYQKTDILAGRAFVKAYVEFIHYVEAVYNVAAVAVHGHFPESNGPAAHQHGAEEALAGFDGR